MDLSYRKAGKMDPTDFMTRFHPGLLGLSEFVRGQLLEGAEDWKGLRTELYKLNVYGQLSATPYYSRLTMVKERTLSLRLIKIHLAV